MYKNFELSKYQYNFKITKKHAATIDQQIQKINYKRIKIFSYVVLLFELLLILFYDLPRIFENSHRLIYKVYFGLHFFMLLTSLGALFLLHKHQRYPQRKLSEYFEAIIVLLFMTAMAVIGFLDLVRSDQMISYVSMLTFSSITVLIKPPQNYIVYTIPHSIFLGLSFYFVENRHFFMGNLINTTMYFACILILSRLVYQNQYSHIVKNIALMEANQELAYLSNHDSLTNISNRRHFEAKVEEQHLNNSQSQAVLTMMDLDNFKQVNDQYGHNIGDFVVNVK